MTEPAHSPSLLKGSLALLISALYLVYKGVLFVTGLKSHPIFSLFPPWPLLLGLSVVMAVDNLRDSASESFIYYFKKNARFSLLTAFFTTLTVWIYYQWIDVSAFQEMIEQRMEAFKQQPRNFPAEEFEKNLHRIFNPFFYSTMTLSGLGAFGLLMSAGIAALKKFLKIR